MSEPGPDRPESDEAEAGAEAEQESGRSFKILARPMRRQSFDLVPEHLREGDHIVRVTSRGRKLFDTPRGTDLAAGLEGAFAAIRSDVLEES